MRPSSDSRRPFPLRHGGDLVHKLLSRTGVEHRAPVLPSPPVADEEADHGLAGAGRQLDSHVRIFPIVPGILVSISPCWRHSSGTDQASGQLIEELQRTLWNRGTGQHGLERHPATTRPDRPALSSRRGSRAPAQGAAGHDRPERRRRWPSEPTCLIWRYPSATLASFGVEVVWRHRP